MPNLSGADISSYQPNIDWSIFKDNINFVIVKVCEGAGLIDPWFGYNRQQARQYNIPLGFYAFARPDLGNTPQQEAQLFINLINGQPLQEGESIYLDYEVQYGGDNVAWVLEWMQIVEKALGVKPIFYSYQSMLTSHDWTAVINNGNGLWVAAPTDPSNPSFNTGQWPFAMMCQWGQQNIPGFNGQTDSDIFFGDQTQFKLYGYHQKQEESSDPQQSGTPIPSTANTIPSSNSGTPAQPQVPIDQTQPITSPDQPNPPISATPPTTSSKDNILFRFWQWLIKTSFYRILIG